jgi:hypothetical protein
MHTIEWNDDSESLLNQTRGCKRLRFLDGLVVSRVAYPRNVIGRFTSYLLATSIAVQRFIVLKCSRGRPKTP